LFRVGDKVVYPMHGAGVIEAIEEREVLGRRQNYYVMRLPLGEMQVLIPTSGPNSVLRAVVGEAELAEAFAVLSNGDEVHAANWSRRYRANLEKMRTGDICAVAEVVRNLHRRDRQKGLSTGERKMLDNARQILLSEIILARNMREDQASHILDAALAE